MGIFSFRKKDKIEVAEAPKNVEKEPYYGDLHKTKILRSLFNAPQEERSEEWKMLFFNSVAEASFICGNPQVIEGPDGFPYFQLNLPEPGKTFQCYVIKNMIGDFLLEKGYGVVINQAKDQPDWVFTYGDIVNYHIRKEFYTKSESENIPKAEIFKAGQKVFIGQPSEFILPIQTRTVIRDFLKSVGIDDVKLLLLTGIYQQTEFQELVFNITPDKFEKEEHFIGLMKTLVWYFPRHYSFVSADESKYKDNFVPL